MPSVRPKTSHTLLRSPQENHPSSPNTLRTKKSSSAGLFRLFSKGSPNVSKQELVSTIEEEGRPSVSTGLREIGLHVEPCNFIRPQGLKLEPRKEMTAIRSRSSSCRTKPPETIPPVPNIDTALKSLSPPLINSTLSGGRVLRRNLPLRSFASHLTVDANIANSKLIPGSPMMSPVSPIQDTGLPAFASLQDQFVVGRISKGYDSLESWTSWLRSYANGEFNVQNPPKPPPLSESFSHLPAVCPSNEKKRSSLSRKHELAWCERVQERVAVHIRGAMEKLGTRYAAMSFFDEEYEVFKAENGYNVPRIQRSISIAAHALYTTEVLSVVDTTKDWRFEKNPMVTGKPRIRFFAAAPMVSTEGEILAVLSIFSREPRDIFSHDQRRLLADCSAALMAEMDANMRLHAQKSTGFTPSLRVKISNNNLEKPSRIRLSSFSNTGSFVNRDLVQAEVSTTKETQERTYLVPPPLRFHKLNPQTDTLGRIFTEKPSAIHSTGPVEHTPPSSVESCQVTIYEGPQSTSMSSQTFTSTEYRPRRESLPTCRVLPSSPELEKRSTTPVPDKKNTINSRHEVPSCFENMSYSPEGYRHPSPNSEHLWRDEELISDDYSLNFEELPASHGFGNPCPQPSWSSNITSNNPLKPNTSSQALMNQDFSHHRNFDITVADFLSLSDGDLSEQSGDSFPEESESTTGSNHTSHRSQPHINISNISTGGCEKSQLNKTSPKSKTKDYDEISQTFISTTNETVHEPKSQDTFHMWKFPRAEKSTSESISPTKLVSKYSGISEGKNSTNSRNSSSDYSTQSSIIVNNSLGLRLPCQSHLENRNDAPFSSQRTSDVPFELSAATSSNYKSQRVSIEVGCRNSQVPSTRTSPRPSLALSTASSTSRKRITKETISQTAFALASYGKQMGYSLMYVAKVKSRVKNSSESLGIDLSDSDNLEVSVQILTAYGLEDAVQLCPSIHLRVLRTRGPTSWEDFNDKGEFQKGILMVIKTEGGPLKYRSKGLILGAFRDTQPGQIISPDETTAELSSLTELTRCLKKNLMTSTSSNSSQGAQVGGGLASLPVNGLVEFGGA